jgi:beta-glucosidase/6-phospho-beta-glucosidase/beta-galactosidase
MPFLFKSFLFGGFECSSHQLRTGRRLDVLGCTQSSQIIRADFQRLQAQRIYTVRSGIRWHQIEERPYRYDFSNELPQVRMAHEMKMQVIWDLCHYGWPTDLDIFSPKFVERFEKFASAFVRLLKVETDQPPLLAPINEISFLAWAGGDVAYLNPFATHRGLELKVQLVRATLAAIEAIWEIQPQARIVHIDPVISILPRNNDPAEVQNARTAHLAQWQAWDMIAGRSWPGLGGKEAYLDIIGINYYSNNQWIHQQSAISRHHPLYRPFRQLIADVHTRYGRPFFISETGIENEARPDWLHYIANEVRAAQQANIPVQGICWYPILNHPGWDDDRHCHNGLWDYADKNGAREIYQPLAQAWEKQRQLFAEAGYTAL